MQPIQQIKNINLEAEESFWLKLAELGEKRSFKKWSIFGGLCEVMLEIAKREEVCKFCIILKNIQILLPFYHL